MTAIPGGYASLNPYAKARVAFMRFGLGPKPGGRIGLGDGEDAAYQACLRELNNRTAAEISDNEVLVKTAPSGNSFPGFDGTPYPATIKNCGAISANPLSGNYNLAILEAESTSRYLKYLGPEVGFVERLVLFWNNHFSVYNGKARATVGHLERSAIRKNVLGKFGDMLEAVITHPAMITYLDNQSSYGPNSKIGAARKWTYNENLAREILELHTLGVNGGYSQQDVTEFAKVLTGWHVGSHRSAAPGQFTYIHDAHEPGAITVLGKTYGQADGLRQGKAVLRDLAVHPKTAEHIAYKLIRHFVKDEPATQDVDRLAEVFTSTNGDLYQVSKALLELPSAWVEPFTRIKQPYQWLVSITRGLDMNATQVAAARWGFDIFCGHMGHSIWWRLTPDGWPEDNSYWMTPNAMRIRNDLSARIVSYCFNSTRWPGPLRPPALAEDLLGPVSNDVRQQFVKWDRDDRASIPVLFMMSEYLRR